MAKLEFEAADKQGLQHQCHFRSCCVGTGGLRFDVVPVRGEPVRAAGNLVVLDPPGDLYHRENSRGLTEIESKEARNLRGIPGSPDRAESLIMAFMKVVPQQTTVTLENFQMTGYEISPY